MLGCRTHLRFFTGSHIAGLAVDLMHCASMDSAITPINNVDGTTRFLVPLHRIELQIADYKTAVIPFNYKGKTLLQNITLAERRGLEPRSRINDRQISNLLQYHYGTSPYCSNEFGLQPYFLNWCPRGDLNS